MSIIVLNYFATVSVCWKLKRIGNFKWLLTLLYIGPMVNSLNDFWCMIWENRVPTIVMLTRVFEGKVCDDIDTSLG